MEDKLFATRALSEGIWGDEMNPTDTPRTDALIALGFTREALDQAIDSHAELERELSAARQEIAALELERGTVLATEKGLTPAGEQVARLEKEIAGLRERAYKQGFIDGITAYAWYKDGVQHVGTTGKTRADAIANVEKTWNYAPSALAKG